MKKLIFSLYFLFLLFLTWFSYLFIDPNLIYLRYLYTGIAYINRSFVSLMFFIFIVFFFLFYIYFLKLAKEKKITKKEIIILIIGSFIALFFSYPAMVSYDIFNYITTAKVTFFYHENPYLIMPIEFSGDPFLLFTHASNKFALYGCFWIILSGIPYLLGFGNFILTLFNFKLFVSLFYFALIWLIWKISKNNLSIVFFALNPLVLFETFVSGHNDVIMMFFALLSLDLIFKKRTKVGILVFSFSFLIKYATLFLFPVLICVWNKLTKNKEIIIKKVWLYCFLFMFLIFLLSQFREEIYPWYAIWFLVFVSFLVQKKVLLISAIILSFGLELRYIPYMFLGTHFGPTPLIKFFLSFVPLVIYLLIYSFKKINFSKKQ